MRLWQRKQRTSSSKDDKSNKSKGKSKQGTSKNKGMSRNDINDKNNKNNKNNDDDDYDDYVVDYGDDNLFHDHDEFGSSSRRSFPSPQSSVIGTSVSSFSGNVNISSSRNGKDNNDNMNSTRNTYNSSQKQNFSTASQRCRSKSNRNHNGDIGNDNGNGNDNEYSVASRSHNNLSLASSKSRESTLSNGSSLEQDSFVVMSTTGLSSTGSSFNSFYSYDPFTGRHEHGGNNDGYHYRNNSKLGNGNRDGNRGDDSGSGDGGGGGGDDDNRLQTSNTSHHYLHNKQTSKRLPRLTVSTNHTKAYLGQQNSFEKQKQTHKQQKQRQQHQQLSYQEFGAIDMNTSPQSSTTAGTEPITPHDKNDDHIPYNDFDDNDDETKRREFPLSTQHDITPQFHIPVNPSPSQHQQSSSGIHNNSSIPSSMQNNSTLSRNASSSCDSVSTSCASFNSTRQMSMDNKMMQAAIAEKEFWKRKIRETVRYHGKESVETARQLNNLGCALLRCKEHKEALSVYQNMIGILRRNFDDDSLVFARALDKVGHAASMCPSQQNFEWALLALDEALHIRLSRLGPHHCDTVDSLNNIAGLLSRMKEWARAKEAYVDVLTVRAAIFGNYHPSVAVTAQVLGKVCSHLSDFPSSMIYFELALSIYREEPMLLRDSHPLIKKTLRNIDRTERLMVSLGLKCI